VSAPLVLGARNLAAVPGIAHGFSTRVRDRDRADPGDFDLRNRVGERDRWLADRRSFLTAIGLPGGTLVTLGQTHEDRIYEIGADGPPPEAPPSGYDAVVSTRPGVAIAIGTADCLPILVADPRRRVVAAVHAGWRSSALGLPARVVRLLIERYGSTPSDLVVALGPSIGPCCFEVGEEVVEALASAAGGVGEWTVRRSGRKPHVDLARANERALVAAGVAAASIERVPGCTVCEARRFFSFRREGAGTGRQLSVAAVLGPGAAGAAVAAIPAASASSTSA
jgi:YfiH family protein